MPILATCLEGAVLETGTTALADIPCYINLPGQGLFITSNLWQDMEDRLYARLQANDAELQQRQRQAANFQAELRNGLSVPQSFAVTPNTVMSDEEVQERLRQPEGELIASMQSAPRNADVVAQVGEYTELLGDADVADYNMESDTDEDEPNNEGDSV